MDSGSEKLMFMVLRFVWYVYVCVVVFPAVLLMLLSFALFAGPVVVAEKCAAWIAKKSGEKEPYLLRNRIAEVLMMLLFGQCD